MTYTLHPDAERDIADASDFYEKQAGIVTARRFLDEFERVAKLLDRNPEAGAPLTKARRMFPLKVFPYAVVYRIIANHVQILIVRHQRRRPGFGMSRS